VSRKTREGVPRGDTHHLADRELLSLGLAARYMANVAEIVTRADQALADSKHVIFDLDETTFIYSSVINALFHARQAADRCGLIVVVQLRVAGMARLREARRLGEFVLAY
jgi:hypothetical protein